MTRVILALICISLALPTAVSASVDVCSDPRMQARLAVGFVTFEESAFDEVNGNVELQYNNYDLLFKTGSDKFLFGAGHRYDVFNVDSLQTDTNGHLHTFFLPLHIVSGNDQKNFRFSIAPAFSSSSNIIKDPAEYKLDAVQLLAALVWGRQINERLDLRYGICGDHRFGEYQVYAAASVLWQPHPDWLLQLGFPESGLSYRFSDSLSSDIHIGPDGNEWYVEDKSLTRNSRFIYEAYAVEWSLDWHITNSFTVTAGVGQQFDNQFEFTLLDQSVARLSGDSVWRFAAGLEWRF